MKISSYVVQSIGYIFSNVNILNKTQSDPEHYRYIHQTKYYFLISDWVKNLKSISSTYTIHIFLRSVKGKIPENICQMKNFTS